MLYKSPPECSNKLLIYAVAVVTSCSFFLFRNTFYYGIMCKKNRGKKNDETRFGLYCNLADSLIKIAPDSSILYADKALSIALNSENKDNIASAYNLNSKIYTTLFQFDSAISHMTKAIEIYQSEKDSINLLSNYVLLAKKYVSIGKYDTASSLFFIAA